MAAHKSAAPVLELRPRPANREAPVSAVCPVTEVHETPTDIVVRVRLQQGAVELSVPKRALAETQPDESVLPGANPDATPC
jgi:mRNA-degrading endonuclease toxin of MazEF toxin-antitoxin module